MHNVIWGMLWTSLWIAVSAHSPVLTMMSGEVCFGSRVDLLCTHPDPLDDPVTYLPQVLTWAENGTTIDFTDPASARFTPTRENSTVAILSFNITEEDHRDRVILCSCFLVRNNANRDRVESEALVLDPPEKPKAPIITSLPSNSSNLTKWTHDSSCYSQCTFAFILTWTKMADPPDSPSSGSDMTTDTQYDFSSLPRGEYSVSIRAQCMENTSIESDVTSTRISLKASVSSQGTTTSPTDTLRDQTTIIIAVLVVVIVLIAIAILIIVGFVCVCVRSKKPKTCPTHQTGQMSPDPPKCNLYGRVIYAELEHSQGRPVPAPSQGSVEYTQAIQVGKHPPPALPPPYKGAPEKDEKEFGRQDSNKSNEFKTQVVTIFQKVQIVRAPVTSAENVLGNYKKTTFIANLVYVEDEGQDVSDRDIERVTIARSRHGTDKGLLVSNTETIQGSLMEKLEKNGCHFIGLRTSDKHEVTEDLVMKKLDLVFT